MRRGCDRPGCVRVATAGFVFDGAAQLVRLVSVEGDHTYAGLLCVRHARTFTAPVGWNVRDERATPTSPTTQAPASRAPRPRRVATADVHAELEQPTLGFEVAEATSATERAAAGAGQDGASDTEHTEDTDETDESSFEQLLDAESPLLSRAFRTAHPR